MAHTGNVTRQNKQRLAYTQCLWCVKRSCSTQPSLILDTMLKSEILVNFHEAGKYLSHPIYQHGRNVLACARKCTGNIFRTIHTIHILWYNGTTQSNLLPSPSEECRPWKCTSEIWAVSRPSRPGPPETRGPSGYRRPGAIHAAHCETVSR